ncbi:gephyrin-like molybdotransferase Glp [Rhizobium halophytocola]|uniref:Molybdopterin molybdenumtransferase n=1 Tax=Rhizobium halophytocola TaxID=735519 RepID=A0ABS4DWD3_9HYPH|nr:gephyrin-like molybdotransferase Glp [Rhizobium halophytocola]MBP1850008.1 molybdopterin molybdotransferase [Rhizobium halophytocola]
MSDLLPVADALARILDAAVPVIETETLPLDTAAGRILADAVTARLTQPPFNASAMDGYALRAEDAPRPGAALTVIGESAAGHAFDGEIGPGEAVRIFTGAPVPDNADAILLQEDAERLDEKTIRTTFPVAPGRHIRPRGQDFTEGETVLAAGTLLDFPRLTLAAAANHAALSVYRRPRVAILATGDELVTPGSALGPSQIVCSNTFGVAALARGCGADVIDLGIAADSPEAITAAVDAAVAAKADILVTLGGASVGDHDLVQSTLVAAGMTLDFWRIAMRPGKPLMVGDLNGMAVLGLPGNPVSSMVCSLLFLEPLILKLAHRGRTARLMPAIAGVSLKANDKRQDHLRATLARDSTGQMLAMPFEKQDSSMTRIFAEADCLIVRPPFAPKAEAGSAVDVLLLRPVGV